MSAFLQKYWRIAFATLVVAGLLLLAVSGYLAPVIRLVLNPVTAVQSWFGTRYLELYNLARSPGDVNELRRQNELLRTENALLRSQLIQLQEQQKDFTTLDALLKVARSRVGSDFLAAMVIGRDPSPFMRYVYINQGSDSGLKRGMPVLTDQGLAGRISYDDKGDLREQKVYIFQVREGQFVQVYPAE